MVHVGKGWYTLVQALHTSLVYTLVHGRLVHRLVHGWYTLVHGWYTLVQVGTHWYRLVHAGWYTGEICDQQTSIRGRA